MAKREQMRTLSGVGVAVVCACALVTACGGSDDGDASASTTSVAAEATTSAPSTTESTTTTTIDEEEAAILAAVDGLWQSHITINSPPDPDHPDLARFRAGSTLESAQARTEDRRVQGHAIRLPESTVYSHETLSVQVDDDRAFVVDCSVDDSVLYDIASGTILDDAVLSNEWEITLTRSASGWLISDVLQRDQWQGVAGCAS